MVYLSNDYLIKETHDLEKQTLFSYSFRCVMTQTRMWNGKFIVVTQ